jgi:flavorubredoxin
MTTNIMEADLALDRPIKIAEDVYSLGFRDDRSGLYCNPYLIQDGVEAVVIDGGSQPHFPTVMMKILQTGLNPSSIVALVYQHYDPDNCGSISNFEDLIDRKDLKIITDSANKMFISHYANSSPLLALESVKKEFVFSSGRKLEFIKTPYAHTQGSFVTLDIKTGTLFSSDLFGNNMEEWSLFIQLDPRCKGCRDLSGCSAHVAACPLLAMLKFHQKLIPSEKALRYALSRIRELHFTMIAPQHGSIISKPEDIKLVLDRLASLKGVGIDGVAYQEPRQDLAPR